MKRAAQMFLPLCVTALLSASAPAQSPSPGVSMAESAQLDLLGRKLDEQNAKIDHLTQQLIHLEQSMGSTKSGASPMETPAETPAPSTTATISAVPASGGNNHLVARGETLTSIAKMHKVTIEELQKQNHITDDRKLQIGQTLIIPPASGATPAASTAPSATATPSLAPQ